MANSRCETMHGAPGGRPDRREIAQMPQRVPSAALTRRAFLHASAAGVLAAAAAPRAAALEPARPHPDLARQLGVTTGSFLKHLSASRAEGKLRLLDLPKIMRDDLDLKVIDLMTATIPAWDAGYLDELKGHAADAGCVITNLKMNQPGLDMTSADADTRERALNEYRRTIDAAQRLGCRWVRPLPGPKRPDFKTCAAAYRELIDYAKPRGIELLIENFGWMQDDPDGIPQMIEQVGAGLHAQPDTGNWSDKARYDGLARAFPLAVSCDFKAKDLGTDGTHAAYDLKRCFHIGWQSGFRGPWCFEHAHAELSRLWQDLVILRNLSRKWMAELD